MDKGTFFIYIVLAAFCGQMLFWFIMQATEKHLSLYDLYQYFRLKYPEYTYLVDIHVRAFDLYQQGLSKDEVARRLANERFRFMTTPLLSSRLISAVEYAKRVLLNRLLIDIYLVNNSFSFSDYQKLCQDMESLPDDQEPLILLKTMLIVKIPDLEKLMQLGAIIAHWQSSPYLGAVVSGDKVSKGKNQTLLFDAMKGVIIDENTEQIAFVNMMKGLKNLFPSITPVTSPAMSQKPTESKDNKTIMLIREEIRKRIAELSL